MKLKQQTLYKIMVAGGVLGMTAAFLQTLEKLVLLQNANAALPCNFNSIFNCSAVLSAWQSSLFGFPNSIMCMTLFTIFTATAFVGAMGGTLTRGTRLIMQGLSLATLAFALWFLWTSTYVIGALCVFCLFCFAGLLAVNWGWLRLNVADLPIGRRGQAVVQGLINKGFDTLLWAALAATVAVLMALRFSL